MRPPPPDCLRFQYTSTSSRVLARVLVTLMTAVSLWLVLGLAVEATAAAAAPASVARTDHPRMYYSAAAAAAAAAAGARALPAAAWPPAT
ncbi:hypothetical protein GUJ93_ZPchr0008g13896 [Zizania palustris]|uniref:Uncharacterized protein n=1 Tax=Zizania palustris TaxID=103762 RepID=A0A8J5V0X6_ZIZPA|nr:hypothetical protein GUJ93_ZPchr0008g13896 [Zizania palustris]